MKINYSIAATIIYFIIVIFAFGYNAYGLIPFCFAGMYFTICTWIERNYPTDTICSALASSDRFMFIEPYNEVKHEKIKSDNKPNELLERLIKIGNEDKPVVVMLRKPLEEVTSLLTCMTEAETSHVINYIVKEVKRQKEKK